MKTDLKFKTFITKFELTRIQNFHAIAILNAQVVKKNMISFVFKNN